MKEDLAVFRLVPEDGIIPDYETGQFITLGIGPYLVKTISLFEEHTRSLHTLKIKNS